MGTLLALIVIFCLLGTFLKFSVKYLVIGAVGGVLVVIVKELLLRSRRVQAAPAEPSAPETPESAAAADSPAPVKKMGFYPEHADGQPLQYSYRLEFEPEPGVDVRADILAGEEKIVQVGYDDETGDVLLVHEGTLFGRIHNAQQANMVRDYLGRKNPVGAILLEDCKTVVLRYYRDRRIGQEWREQTVVKLQNCKSTRRQELIASLTPGDELDIEEDEEGSGKLYVTEKGQPIGTIPAKLARRFYDDGGYLIAVERIIDETDDDFKHWELPELRIFW